MYDSTDFLHLLRTGKCRTLKMWFCHLSTELYWDTYKQSHSVFSKSKQKFPEKSGAVCIHCRQSVREKTWVKWGWRLKNRLKFTEIMQTKFVRRENSSKKLVKLSWVIWIFQNMSNDGRRSSATKVWIL